MEPLVQALRAVNYSVWYDKFSLKPGDSLRRSIDEGLAQSAAGIVVLSKNFYLKEWALRELDALTNQQIHDGKRIINIWLDVTHKEVAEHSPLLNARWAGYIVGYKRGHPFGLTFKVN